MKSKLKIKIITMTILIIQMIQIFIGLKPVNATFSENEEITLYADHECDSVVEFYNEKLGLWSYKVVYYVYYSDKDTNQMYPAFCIEPAKDGVGTGYDSYTTKIHKIRDINGIERENEVWRILNKGYMGSNYQNWNLECDDDLYSATKIALHCLVDGIAPVDKYVLGDRSVDGNTVEEIQRRGSLALEVAQKLYEYGLNGKEIYEEPNVSIKEDGKEKTEKIGNTEYYVQNYIVNSNRELKSYEVSIQNLPSETKILDLNNKEITTLNAKKFKVAVPTAKIQKEIKGNIIIKNAYVKTNPVFYCESMVEDAQSYATYSSAYEITTTNIKLNINVNKSELLIKKIDEGTNNPMSNVTFEILDVNKNKIEEVTTNEKGEACLKNLRSTNYICKRNQNKGWI